MKITEAVMSALSGHVGKDNSLSKRDLLYWSSKIFGTRFSDRAMRKAIETLRRQTQQGAFICSDLQGGYYVAANLDELQEYLHNEESRIISLARKVNRQRKVAGLPLAGQLALVGIEDEEEITLSLPPADATPIQPTLF